MAPCQLCGNSFEMVQIPRAFFYSKHRYIQIIRYAFDVLIFQESFPTDRASKTSDLVKIAGDTMCL
jgi:hypothetical protein